MASKQTSTINHVPTMPAALAIQRLQRFIEEVPQFRGVTSSSPDQNNWRKSVKLFLASFYGPNSLEAREFDKISFSVMSFMDLTREEEVEAMNDGLDHAEGFLSARLSEIREESLLNQPASAAQGSASKGASNPKKVFLVHGHDEAAKNKVARFITRLKLEAIILHEQADRGRTIIEKFEQHATDVGCAIAILTPDDTAEAKASPGTQELRARQNVIMELGYFLGRLGRRHTIALLADGVTAPSDIGGLLYIKLNEDWEMKLVRELKAAGLDVDANALF